MKRENTDSWVNVMDGAIRTYNSLPHTGIGEKAPKTVWDGEKKPDYVNTEQQVRKDLKVGDKVRYQRELGMFEKKSMAEKWSKQVYTITKVVGKNFTIESSSGETLRGLSEFL